MNDLLKILNVPVFKKETTESTNVDVRNKLESGEYPPFLVMARVQSRGYGQRGNKWVSEPGNLHFSMALSVGQKLAKISQILPKAVIAAICSLIRRRFSVNIGVKWPNDLLISGKKMGGAMLELKRGQKINQAILGIGINILHSPKLYESFYETTCLSEHTGENIDFESASEEIIKEVIFTLRRLETATASEFCKVWNDCDVSFHKKILIEILGNRGFRGINQGIAENGELVVEKDDGSRIFVSQGNAKISIW